MFKKYSWFFLFFLATQTMALTVQQESFLTLNGPWFFSTDPGGRFSCLNLDKVNNKRTISVPSSWESAFPDLVQYDGFAWYWRSFHLPERWRGKRILITFKAADYIADVWLNGKKIGSHEGGYTPFTFDLTDKILFRRKNDLAVRVFDPSSKEVKDLPLLKEIPAGKQGHYCNIGGLWQGVYLTARPDTYLKNIFISGNPMTGKVKLKVVLNKFLAEPALLKTVLFPEKDSNKVTEKTFTLEKDAQVYNLDLDVKDPLPWSPETPALYTAEFSIFHRRETDRVFTTFGFRTIEIKKGRILLNGKPVLLRFALDQDFYPKTIYSPPSFEYVCKQFQLGKELGLNGNRTHIKIPSPTYIKAADNEGFLLWIDFPSWFSLTSRTSDIARKQMREWINRDFNHPSIIAWCLINEEWGLDMKNPEMRTFLKEWWKEVKKLDPTRLVVDNSPAGGNHVISDIADQHAYFAIPEQRKKAEEWIRSFASSRKQRFPWSDSEMRGSEPLIWSEMGDWGLPDVERILAFYDSREPYWFNQNNYGGPIRGGIERFKKLGIDKAYGGLSSLARATELHEEQALRYQLTFAMQFPEISGYVITQFTDLNSESNGLLDMTRGKKIFHNRLHEFVSDIVVIPQIEKYSFYSGEKIALKAGLANWSRKSISDAMLLVVESGRILQQKKFPATPTAEVKWCTLEPITLKTADPQYREILFILKGKNQAKITQNRIRILVAPKKKSCALVPLSSIPVKLKGLFKGGSSIYATCALDKETIQVLKQGKKVIYFPGVPTEEPGARQGEPGSAQAIGGPGSAHAIGEPGARQAIGEPGSAQANLAATSPATSPATSKTGRSLPLSIPDKTVLALPFNVSGKWPGGGWMQPQFFFRKDGSGALLAGFPETVHMELALEKASPKIMLRGLTDDQFRKNAIVGSFSGWAHDPAASLALFRAFKGQLLIYGFNTEFINEDPASMWLLSTIADNFAFLPPIDLGRPIHFFNIIITPGKEGEEEWQYTTQRPAGSKWKDPGFDSRTWQKGSTPFGTIDTPGITPRTEWFTADIWLRKEFILKEKIQKPILILFHDEDCEIYLNGQLLLKKEGFVKNYREIRLDKKAQGLLKPGPCLLAVHCTQTTGGQGIDLGIKGQ